MQVVYPSPGLNQRNPPSWRHQEQVIPKWLDGSPIAAKLFQFNCPKLELIQMRPLGRKFRVEDPAFAAKTGGRLNR